MVAERYRHKPYFKAGFPQNLTVRLHSNATFECPTVSDLEPHLTWYRGKLFNSSTTGELIQV